MKQTTNVYEDTKLAIFAFFLFCIGFIQLEPVKHDWGLLKAFLWCNGYHAWLLISRSVGPGSNLFLLLHHFYHLILQWLSMRKQIVKHRKIKKIKGDLTYVGTFPVNLRMALIFTDFPTGSWSPPCAVLEICKYQRHPWVHWESSNVGRIIYNCAILFLVCMSSSFFCASKFFPIDNHCKRLNEFSDPLKTTRIFWTLLGVLKVIFYLGLFCQCWKDSARTWH